MSISVQHGIDTYTFTSNEGKHYWFLSNTPRQTYSKMIGTVANFQLANQLYEAALSAGYTDYDFEKVRTYLPVKQNRVSAKSKRVTSPRILSDRKAPVRKSTLSNSIKLF